jgi:uncharacterized protein YegP (UPF0339 family)
LHFFIYKDVQGYWRWNLKASNGQIIASGEGYVNKTDCLHAIGLVQSSASAKVYE